jgi:hypothetical protein
VRKIVFAAAAACSLALPAAAHAQRIAPDIGGVSCDAMEGTRLHIHQHLTIIDHGKEVPIPFNVGQVPAAQCLYWIHTHTPDGIIHIEAPKDRAFTLADFFRIWGQPLSRTRAATASAAKGGALRVWLNGKVYTGDPALIPLTHHADIVIQAGGPYKTPAPFTDWRGQ